MSVKNWSEFDIVHFLCRCLFTQIILQLTALLVLLLLHVLAENHGHCLGAKNDMTVQHAMQVVNCKC